MEPTYLESLVDISIVIHHLSFPGFSLGALEGRGDLTQDLEQEEPEAYTTHCLHLPAHRVAQSSWSGLVRGSRQSL
jgi:hypothetical protein